jgi:hypothetical protein
MLSLIFISLKQNTSLLIEAQLKHSGNRKPGLAAPTEAPAAAGDHRQTAELLGPS